MRMMSFANLRLEKGQPIVVTTKSGKFYGKFNKLADNGERMEIVEVMNGIGEPCGKFKFFLSKDVVEFEVCGKAGNGQVKELKIDSNETGTCNEPQAITCTGVSPEQMGCIQQTILNCVLFQRVDASYFEALKDISKHFVIGLSAAGGGHTNRFYNIDYLTISTPEKIYVFDMIRLDANKTMEELKDILQSDSQLKVVYDCRGLKGNFEKNFNIDIVPVFDLMLGAAQIYPIRKVLDLSHCVQAILGSDHQVKSKINFSERPAKAEKVEMIANQTAFHLAMYHRITQKILIDAFHKQSEVFLSKNLSIVSLIESETSQSDEEVLERIISIHPRVTQREIDFGVYRTQ